MRIALLSDLHGNEVALRAVKRSLDAYGVDQIICLGDVATLGPAPGAVLAMLREWGCPCILGNHDEFLLEPTLIRGYTEAPVVVDSVDWCRDELTADELGFVATFLRSLEVPLEAGAKLFLFHGTPRSHMENLLASTPAEEVDRMLEGHRGTVMAGGHTHLQMVRQHRGTLLVNPGSVGLAFKEFVAGSAPTLMPHAEYAVVESTRGEVAVSLRRVPLEGAALRSSLSASDLPLRQGLEAEYAAW